jgi:hypothetical protein
MIIDYKDRAWFILQQLKECGEQTRDSVVGGDDYTKEVLANLIRAGLVKPWDSMLSLTVKGSRTLRKVNEEQDGPTQIVGKRTISTGTVTGTYDGKELRRTCLRCGAYDAFELPSLIGEEHHYRREIAA